MMGPKRLVAPSRVSYKRRIRSARGQGNGLSSTPYARLKSTVVAPTPSAIVRVATAAKPGWRRSRRQA